MSIEVVKRDGRSEEFDREKIAKTVMDAAYNVGGDDYELAEEVAEAVEDRLDESDIRVIKSTDLQKVVEEVLIKRGHDQTAREYIVEGAARNRQREMNTQIMKEIEEITFVAPDQSETKRENANIDSSTAMGVMLKYGSESAKKFNLMTVISSKVANAHIDGDIHIHDLDFYTLTETCICKDAVLKIKENGKEYEITFGDFMLHVVKELYKLNGISLDRVYDVSDYDIEVMSKGKYTKVVNVVAHSSIGKKTMRIWLENGDNVSLTSDHRVVTKDASGEKIDKKAEELVVGELISTGSGDFVAIKQLEDINYMACVYDMETENHYFTANNINVHNCCQIPLDKLFNGGFNTGHGFLRQPSGIRAAGALAAIAVQSNQNDQHGGQSIPLFDFYLAPYVALTYVKQIAKVAKIKLDLSDEKYNKLKSELVALQKKYKMVMNDKRKKDIKKILNNFFTSNKVKCSEKRIDTILQNAYDETYNETFQSMEAFVHNLNTMHSRAGAQVPFSSINYGTDTSTEGRMIIETILKTTEDGLGNGETPIFPIQIFKLKAGVSYNPEDPNYDLFKLACRVSAKRLYPNFDNLDAEYNKAVYVEGHPETEVAYMGCVESSEIIRYRVGGKDFIDPFGVAYSNIENIIGKVNNYSENSEYIDVSSSDVCVYDSSSGDFVTVTKFIKNKNVNNFRVVTFNNGYSVTLTGDHPLPVIGKGRTFVDDMTIGDKVAVANSVFDYGQTLDTRYFGNTIDSAWLLGLLLTDSSYSANICISLGLDEYDIVNRVKSTVESLGCTVNIKEQHRGEKGDYVDVFINGMESLKGAREELCSIFGGYKKNERRLTTYLLSLNSDYRNAILAGLIDGDGHVTVSKARDNVSERSARFSLGSTNKALALTELTLIRSLGLHAKLMRNKYSSRHNKIRYLIEFEISADVVNNMSSNKKINKANEVSNCQFSDVNVIEVVKIKNCAEENEISDISYDVETVTDRFDISGIQSHNCRTRVATNVYDPNMQIVPGRGNLSFTSINLPRLAIESHGNIDTFFKKLDNMLELVHFQLLERFDIQCKKHPINYPFLMGQGVWLGSEKLGPHDDIRAILKHGTLTVGFIGLAEALVALTGKHHGESEESQKLGLKIVGRMREYTDAWSKDEKMNYSVIGTPAEGLSGRFIKLDKQKYGEIPGVTDREYYTNSSHVPVYFPISATKKIEIEAPYHALENGGHIAYIEMDGDPTKNLKAFEKVVRYMHDKGVGYGAINHPVDRDPVCGYTGIIGDTCPRCGRRDGEPMTMEMWNKIKGYANAGNSDTLGYHGDPFEEDDRLPNM